MANALMIAGVVGLFLGGAPKAVTPKVPDDPAVWADRVQKAYNGIKDLSAGFEQTVTLKGAGATGVKSSDEVWIQKPGKMRWEFATPEKKVFVSDGKTLWMYEAEENQVIVNEHMQETTSLTGLNFLVGLGNVRKEFDIASAVPPASATVTGAAFLSLRPKDQADVQVSEIIIAIDRISHLVHQVFLIDGLGNETKITFLSPRVNKGLPPERFTFQIPAGAEVIKPSLLQ